MLTVEERLVAYREVLDAAVDEPPAGSYVEALASPLRPFGVGALTAVAAIAAIVVVGIVVLSRPDGARAPIASLPASTSQIPAPSTATTGAPTTPAPVPVDIAALLEPITFRGSDALSDAAQRASNALMTACMGAAGFPFEPWLVGVNIMAPADDQVDAVRAWRAAYDANAALPGYRDAEEGPDGCLGQTFERMYPEPEQRSDVLLEALRFDAIGEIRDRWNADPEYLADLGELAACLAGQGYEVDATLADPERTNEQIGEVMGEILGAAEPVDPEGYEFVTDLLQMTDAPANAICPTFSYVTRTSFNAAERRAGDAWLAEHPDRLFPIRDVMVAEYERFLDIVATAPLVVEFDGQLVEVSVIDGGSGLCGWFLPDREGGCDTIARTEPSVFVTVPTEGDTRTVLYGFMPVDWEAWLEVDGVRMEVSRSEPDGSGRVAIGATVPSSAEAGVVELVRVDEAGTARRSTVDR